MVEWLEKWYKKQCDGDWEHMFGVQIYTLDNPGWRVKIDIADTELEEKYFEEYKEYIDDNYWIMCQIKDKKFDAGGDPSKLEKIIYIFKEWAES